MKYPNNAKHEYLELLALLPPQTQSCPVNNLLRIIYILTFQVNSEISSSHESLLSGKQLLLHFISQTS